VSAHRQVHAVTQANLAQLYPDALSGMPVAIIDEGEDGTSLASIDRLCRTFADSGLLRGDLLVAFGGGVVGDTAGFAAAVYHRGVDVVQVPTTLLAQVDAAIGGKTAVNLPEGKNLVGAFHQPVAVIADTTTLSTLPEREYRSGLGEVAKYACMPEGRAITGVLERERDAVLGRDPEVLARLVAACAAIKASVVAADPGERTGVRATLNLGHTFGHALETVGGYDLFHGEAVAVGLVFALTLAAALGRVDGARPGQVVEMLSSLGLPTSVPEAHSAAGLTEVMRRDKKASGGLTFVLPGPDGLEIVHDPAAHALEKAFAAVGVPT
jgi:5-deoxy-5-amino-3-dehydroquinate synthase